MLQLPPATSPNLQTTSATEAAAFAWETHPEIRDAAQVLHLSREAYISLFLAQCGIAPTTPYTYRQPTTPL